MASNPVDASGNPAEAGSKAVWIAVIGTLLGVILAAVVPMVIEHHKSDEKINFVGIVKKSSGSPLQGAQIMIAMDEETPQILFSDSNGVFHIPLPEKTKSLTLTVSASGFLPVRRDANPHRSGEEEISLDVMQQTLKELGPRSGRS